MEAKGFDNPQADPIMSSPGYTKYKDMKEERKIISHPIRETKPQKTRPILQEYHRHNKLIKHCTNLGLICLDIIMDATVPQTHPILETAPIQD